MLSKINRLRKTKEIERVFEEGRGRREDFLFLKSAKNNSEVTRFAFIVGQKVAKKANSRNKIKRRLRETVKSRLSRIKTGFDVIMIAQKGIEVRNFQEIEKAAEGILKKSNLLK